MPYAYARFVGQGFRDWSILQGERQKVLFRHCLILFHIHNKIFFQSNLSFINPQSAHCVLTFSKNRRKYTKIRKTKLVQKYLYIRVSEAKG